jgi:hypothetical protein
LRGDRFEGRPRVMMNDGTAIGIYSLCRRLILAGKYKPHVVSGRNKRLQIWRFLVKFRSFDDSTSSSIENQLKSIYLKGREVKQEFQYL